MPNIKAPILGLPGNAQVDLVLRYPAQQLDTQGVPAPEYRLRSTNGGSSFIDLATNAAPNVPASGPADPYPTESVEVQVTVTAAGRSRTSTMYVLPVQIGGVFDLSKPVAAKAWVEPTNLSGLVTRMEAATSRGETAASSVEQAASRTRALQFLSGQIQQRRDTYAGLVAGQAVPAGLFSLPWRPGGVFSAQSTIFPDAPVAYMMHANSAPNRWGIAYLDLPATSQGILRQKLMQDTCPPAAAGPGLICKIGGSEGAETAVIGRVDTSAQTLRLFAYKAGAVTELATAVPFASQQAKAYWLELTFVDLEAGRSSYSIKAWADGTPEPASPQLTAETSLIAGTGRVGCVILGGYVAMGPRLFEYGYTQTGLQQLEARMTALDNAEINRQAGILTASLPNVAVGYRDGTRSLGANLFHATAAYEDNPGGFRFPSATVPKIIALTATGTGDPQFAVELLGSAVASLTGNPATGVVLGAGRSVREAIEVRTDQMAAAGGTALFMEYKFRRAGGGDLWVRTAPEFTLAELQNPGLEKTLNGITATVLRATATASMVQYATVVPADDATGPATHAHLTHGIRGVRAGTVRWADPVILMDAGARIDPATNYRQTAATGTPTAPNVGGGGIATGERRGTGGTPGYATTREIGSYARRDIVVANEPLSAYQAGRVVVISADDTAIGRGDSGRVTNLGFITGRRYYVGDVANGSNLQPVPLTGLSGPNPTWPTASIHNVNRPLYIAGEVVAEGDEQYFLHYSNAEPLTTTTPAPLSVRHFDVAGQVYRTGLIPSVLTRVWEAGNPDTTGFAANPTLYADGDAELPLTGQASTVSKIISGVSKGVAIKHISYGLDDFVSIAGWPKRAGLEWLMQFQVNSTNWGNVRAGMFFSSNLSLTSGQAGSGYSVFGDTGGVALREYIASGRVISTAPYIQVSPAATGPVADTIVNMRVSVDEAEKKVYARLWNNANAEPTTWSLNGVAVPNLKVGDIGFCLNNGAMRLHKISFGERGAVVNYGF